MRIHNQRQEDYFPVVNILVLNFVATGLRAAMIVGRRKMSKRRVILVVVVVVSLVATLATWKYASHRARHPYGQSHCCIKGMLFALEEYAEAHNGRYPAGKSSPEASLSLLYQSNSVDADSVAYNLSGMIVPASTIRRILKGGGLLGPDTCGWQYVEGLTWADDLRLALLYCKQPLGHFGERTKNGGREVLTVGGGSTWVSGDKWPAFLEEQKRLLAQRSERAKAGIPLVQAVIELPDGSRLESLDCPYTLTNQSKGLDSSGEGTESGQRLRRSDLAWYDAPLQEGSLTRILSFSNLVSELVTVKFTNGVPDRTNVIFKMKIKWVFCFKLLLY